MTTVELWKISMHRHLVVIESKYFGGDSLIVVGTKIKFVRPS